MSRRFGTVKGEDLVLCIVVALDRGFVGILRDREIIGILNRSRWNGVAWRGLLWKGWEGIGGGGAEAEEVFSGETGGSGYGGSYEKMPH